MGSVSDHTPRRCQQAPVRGRGLDPGVLGALGWQRFPPGLSLPLPPAQSTWAAWGWGWWDRGRGDSIQLLGPKIKRGRVKNQAEAKPQPCGSCQPPASPSRLWEWQRPPPSCLPHRARGRCMLQPPKAPRSAPLGSTPSLSSNPLLEDGAVLNTGHGQPLSGALPVACRGRSCSSETGELSSPRRHQDPELSSHLACLTTCCQLLPVVLGKNPRTSRG